MPSFRHVSLVAILALGATAFSGSNSWGGVVFSFKP
jgi:hypothetical protein